MTNFKSILLQRAVEHSKIDGRNVSVHTQPYVMLDKDKIISHQDEEHCKESGKNRVRL